MKRTKAIEVLNKKHAENKEELLKPLRPSDREKLEEENQAISFGIRALLKVNEEEGQQLQIG